MKVVKRGNKRGIKVSLEQRFARVEYRLCDAVTSVK
jgi:hypothetical protein